MILQTQRLRLRELLPTDLDFVAAMLADPEVMRYYPKIYSRSEAQEWLDRQRRRYETDGHGLWLVEERSTGQPVGQVGLIMQEVQGERLPEMGWLIHRPFWRQGFASEAARAVRRFAFEQKDYPFVISLIRPENEPSQGVAKKLGMTIQREVMFKDFRHYVFHQERSAVTTPGWSFRFEVNNEDRQTVRQIVTDTGFFYDHEIDIAVELVDERLAKGDASGYHFVFAEQNGVVVGYTCFGPIPCTESSHDLYWIAVHPSQQRNGLGRALMSESERRIEAIGGRRVYLDTSNRPQYEPTRRFYQRCGFREEAVLKDFYAEGDDKVIFVKAIQPL